MKKIKFKIEYVPLSDAQIVRHKNFDALMTAFALHPKPTFSERMKAKLFGNKLIIYMGGIITGAVVTSLMWWGANQYQSKSLSEQQLVVNEQKGLRSVTDEQGSVTSNSESNAGNESQRKINPIVLQKDSSVESKKRDEDAKASVVSGIASNGLSDKRESKNVMQSENAGKSSGNKNVQESKEDLPGVALSDPESSAHKNPSVKEEATAIISSFSSEAENVKQVVEGKPEKSDEKIETGSNASANVGSKEFNADTLTFHSEKSDSSVEEPLPSLVQDTTKRKLDFSFPKINLSDEWNSTKHAVSKITDTVGNKTSDFFSRLFKPDSARKAESEAAAKKDSTLQSNSANADTFIHRFAQVSFVTPLSTDGLNGKLYMHNLSFNILQGYTGALNGFELGGLANVESGYVKGFQIGGLVNFALGDVSGMQLGGLVNSGKNVDGFQLGGITNIAHGNMRGMQLGGIANVVADTLTGFQLSGILNLSSEKAPTKSWQLTGIANVSLGEMYGGQVAGIFNLSAQHHGIQTGLINYSKKITGFQLGLINVADTIDGESLGLINISKNGLHKAEVFGSEALYFSGGLKLGSPHLYTLFAAGVAPTKDLTRIGLGIGVGGQFPIDKAFISVDGVCWTIHNDDLNNWEAVNLLNQLRVTGGYRIARGVAIYAGPTYNVHVYDRRYPSVAPYAIYRGNSADNNTYTDMWIGGVVGLQFF